MVSVLILVCSLNIAHADCQRATAIDVVIAPEKARNDLECLRMGLMFAAESRLVMAGSYAKLRCERVSTARSTRP